MKDIKWGETLIITFVIAFITYFFIIPPIWIAITNVWGTETIVTVSFHEKKEFGKPGSIKQTASYGYYYVDGKCYKALILQDIPIGAKFKIKYNPIRVQSYNTIGVVEE